MGNSPVAKFDGSTVHGWGRFKFSKIEIMNFRSNMNWHRERGRFAAVLLAAFSVNGLRVIVESY